MIMTILLVLLLDMAENLAWRERFEMFLSLKKIQFFFFCFLISLSLSPFCLKFKVLCEIAQLMLYNEEFLFDCVDHHAEYGLSRPDMRAADELEASAIPALQVWLSCIYFYFLLWIISSFFLVFSFYFFLKCIHFFLVFCSHCCWCITTSGEFVC